MKNYIAPGKTVSVTAPANLTGGGGCLIGSLFGVVASTVETGETADLQTEGVFDLAKVSADVFTLGAPVYFDADAKQCHSGTDTDSNSAGVYEALIGVAVAAAGAGESTVRVKLCTPVALS